MVYRGGDGGRRGGGGGRPFIWPIPPSTPLPLPMGGYRWPMVLPHQGAYRPNGQAAVLLRARAPQVFSPAPLAAPPPSPKTSPAAPSSTPAPPRQPGLQSASSTPASEPAVSASSAPSPAALTKEVEKKLFVSATALAPPAAAAQGTAGAGADDASDLNLAPVFNTITNAARLGLATLGKKAMIIRENHHFLVNFTRKALRTGTHMDVETLEGSPALAAHLQSSPPQVSKYYVKNRTSSSHSRNVKDDANHDSRIQTRSPLSIQSLTFDAGDEHGIKEKYQRAVKANEKLEKQVFCVKDMCKKMNGEQKNDISFSKDLKEISSFKDELVMALKMGSDQMTSRTKATIFQGGQDRPVRNSSFNVCRPKRRLLWPSGGFVPPSRRTFSSLPEADTADLKPLYDTIGHVNNVVHWPLDGSPSTLQSNYDNCIGHNRLYHCVHGKALDASNLLGSKKTLFTTAIMGTQYIRVSLEEDGKLYELKLMVDAREGWMYGWKNKHGIFQFKDSSSNPYVTDGPVIYLDFNSDYTDMCPGSEGFTHGMTLMGPEAVKVACKVLSEYDGTKPVPLQVRMACSILLNYLPEAMKLHDVQHFNSLSLGSGWLCTLDECEPALSSIMKKWAKLSEPQIHFIIAQQHTPSKPLLKVKGIENLEPLVNAVAIVPFNKIPKQGGNVRTWSRFAEDESANEKPHPLSIDFLRRWPFHESVNLNRPDKRTVDIAAVGPLLTGRVKLHKTAKYMSILKSAAGRQPRVNLMQPSPLAMKIFNWLKAAV